MRIGGLTKCSLIDYPGKISAIVFTIGCNFRCPYCHNPGLVEETSAELDEDTLRAFLLRRRGILEAVTITGGEPTVHDDLPEFIRRVKELGYAVKLDTNGTHPRMLEALIEEHLVDYLAMDIKAPLQTYSATVGRPVPTEAIRESIQLIMTSGLPYEFRTTVVKALLPPEAFETMGEEIRGAARYYLQRFVPRETLNPAFMKKTTYTDEEFERIRARMETYVARCEIR